MPSHTHFNYFFSDVEGITFGTAAISPKLVGDLLIYYDSLTGSDFISCRCSDWTVDKYSISVRTWLKKDDLATLRENMLPGATGELFKILGKPTYYDKSWSDENTIRLVPTSCSRYAEDSDTFTGENNSTLIEKRNPATIYVKNLTTHTLDSVDYWIDIKIEGYISGSRL